MKKIYLILFGILSVLTSCEKEEDIVMPPAYQVNWFDDTNLVFSPIGDPGFTYNINSNSGQSFWGDTEAEYDVKMNFSADIEISKIEFYAFVEENNGETFSYKGGEIGKLLETITNPENNFTLTVSSDKVYQLYSGELSAEHSGELLPEDLVELKWVITAEDGSVLDTRVDCNGFNCTYGIKTSIKYVDTWLGEFEATWTEVGPGTVTYSYSDVVVGAKRTVTFTPGDEEGQYAVDDMAFGGAYGGPKPGYITFDNTTNTLYVYDFTNYKNKWILVSVTPEVLTVRWDNYYNQWYNENGVIELRRSDGLTWPDITEIINNN
ncbi:hypothetical protein [Aestuariibaculum sediminum]|uniref:Uncharacterized protein n=1 Tax=Aestuariibaculum sediminum TaxID=2770637 RepID=A0A8J6U7X3_9FLAO|nr:hypothetical protein [Aestuariibaculum sediminum]MBD0832573.1 hypothetical protein [Aestuariibaculum sediminum]